MNAIVVGARESNPRVGVFETQQNFTIEDDQKTRRFTVSNRSPRSGEQPAYYSEPEDPQHRAYGVVALVPNPDESGAC